MEIRAWVTSSGQAWELIGHVIPVSSNECFSLKSLCSLMGDCGFCRKNSAFFPEWDLDTARVPKRGVCVVRGRGVRVGRRE
jgi:hypothetical protein